MSRYTREEIKKWKEVFSSVNIDGDRYITAEELVEFNKGSGVEMTEDQARALIAEFDRNDNGKIEFSEFIKELGVKTAKWAKEEP